MSSAVASTASASTAFAGQTKNEIEAVFFAPRHHLRAAVMPVTAIVMWVAGQCRRMRRASRRRWPRTSLRARIFAIACGYEDADDLDRLRCDPAFKLACGRMDAGAATITS